MLDKPMSYLSNQATVDYVRELMDEFDTTQYSKIQEDGYAVYNVPDGMARSVWEDKYSRHIGWTKDVEGKDVPVFQTWEQRIREVVGGSFILERPVGDNWMGSTQTYASRKTAYSRQDFNDTLSLSLRGVLAYSGRHLQHGDWDQQNKKLERLSNCSTAVFSFLAFKLGLDGSGVGSDYSNATRRVNWDNMPNIRCVLDEKHPDFSKNYYEFQSSFDSLAEARHKYPSESEKVRWFDVEDTCEGWVAVIAAIETATYHGNNSDKTFIFNFTPVREEGRPIAGQQGRPASGPLPLMRAIMKVQNIKGAGMPLWKQALYIDHYLASAIIIGGVRRMARMATKWWKDSDIEDFIDSKRDAKISKVLWTANHSILVDEEFWEQAKDPRSRASRILRHATQAAYYDRSGEPGFINVDKLNQRRDTLDHVDEHNFLSEEYFGLKLHPKTIEMCGKVLSIVKKQKYFMIVNPCSEIPLSLYGGYCLVGDINGARVDTQADFIRACELMSPFLIRTNMMQSIYKAETDRTNRIGVSMIGIHELAWNLFGLTFYDMIEYFDTLMATDEKTLASNHFAEKQDSKYKSALGFWLLLSKGRDAAEKAAFEYSKKIGREAPHTVTTLKPGGTVSKVMAVTESANLPAYGTYMRWIQYEKLKGGKPNVELQGLIDAGYPMKDISSQFPGKVVVGFPTQQPIVQLMGADKIVTAAEATIEQHYKWLMLLEKFWLGGKNEDGSMRNGQLSYTLKIAPGTSYEEFHSIVSEWQPKIRCCAFDISQEIGEMKSAHVYVPEEPISYEQYLAEKAKIKNILGVEGISDDVLQCASGICPIEPSQPKPVAPEASEKPQNIGVYGGMH